MISKWIDVGEIVLNKYWIILDFFLFWSLYEWMCVLGILKNKMVWKCFRWFFGKGYRDDWVVCFGDYY